MAKFKIEAGAELDVLTKDEMGATLRGWLQESVRGVKFVSIVAETAKTGATFTIGGNVAEPQGTLGPTDGFLWSVMSVNVNGPGVAAADTFVIYDGDTSGTRVRVPTLTNAGRSFQKGEFVMLGPRKIRVTGASTGAGTEIFVAGMAIEVPLQLAWMLC